MENNAPNFGHLESMNIDARKAVEFTFFNIEGGPTLFVRPTSQANKAYLNAVLRTGRRTLRRMRGNKLSVEVLDENRDQDRKLFPKYVITGWKDETVQDSEGNPVPFSKENCELFLRALPNDIFDELRTFCGEPDNFREDDDLGASDVEELAGN